MDAPLAVSVHKENVHVGKGKAAAMVKPDKLKPAKNTGKDRKALGDLKYSHDSTAGALKDCDLKQKSGRKGNQVERNMMTQVKHCEKVTDPRTTNKPLVTGVAKEANLNNKSAFLGSLGKGTTPLRHILTDEEIKQCYEWSKDGIEEMGGYSWSAKVQSDILMNQNISEIMASAIGVPISELESPILSDEEGYKTDGSDWDSSLSFTGRHASIFMPEEIEDPLGVAGIVLDEYPLPELKLNEGHEDVDIDHDNNINGILANKEW